MRKHRCDLSFQQLGAAAEQQFGASGHCFCFVSALILLDLELDWSCRNLGAVVVVCDASRNVNDFVFSFPAGISPPPQPPFPDALTDPLGHPPAVLPPPPALSPIDVGMKAIGCKFLVCPTKSVDAP